MRFSQFYLLLVIMIFTSVQNVLADTEYFHVGQINEIDSSENRILVSDLSFQYDRYLIVQRSGGGNDQRLPLSYLVKNKWVAVGIDSSQTSGVRKATHILLFDNQQKARKFELEEFF